MTDTPGMYVPFSADALDDHWFAARRRATKAITAALLGEPSPPRPVIFEPWVDEGDGPVLVEIHDPEDTRRYRMHATPAELEGLRALERVTRGAVVVHAP